MQRDRSGAMGFHLKGLSMAVRRVLRNVLAALALVTIALTPLSCANAQNADTTLAGKWIVVMSSGGKDYYAWLIELARNDKGAWQANLVESSKMAPEDAALDEF